MAKEEEKLIKGKPTPYASTTPAELDTRNIFNSALDTTYIKGEIRAVDKYPNSDGILELTDIDQFPIGKIDIQLKTLSEKNYKSVKFQCEQNFFSYCENSSLPVFLIVVNRRDKKVYWRHIDLATLSEVSNKMKRKSYSLSIPKENTIEVGNKDYIKKWTEIAKANVRKVWNYDSVNERNKLIESQMQQLNSRLQDPTNLPVPILRNLHFFLDEFNYILDKEFPSVKQILYPNYWKIGIGIIKYEIGDVRYLLFPAEFKKSQILIKKVIKGEYEDFMQEMYNRNILLLSSSKDDSELRLTPVSTAYKILEDDIMRTVKNINFPIPDECLSREYLISFIDKNQGYLDLNYQAEFYSLKDLKRKLYSILPMIAATSKNYADWVVDHNDDIDSYSHWKSSQSIKNRIADAIKLIDQNYSPKVKVTMTSTLYNIELINYYINYLESKGISDVHRLYAVNQFNNEMYGVDDWKTWYKEPVWENTKLFFKKFYELYEKYILLHFPKLKNELQIIDSPETTIVHILHFDEIEKSRPHLEIYYLRPNIPKVGEILFYLNEDPNNPIDRRRFGLECKSDCRIDGLEYNITQMHVQVLDFMFTLSPTYTLIKDTLEELLKKLFNQRKYAQTVL
ncbi:MAG: DUF4365 domain-containing protein [Chitinophagaceae bacterium]|nr:DUF4365 domain-containing protein [Chitinophagaceae bacterium]